MKMRTNLKNMVLNGESGVWIVSGTVLIGMGLGVLNAQAHGFAGKRFFPPTIQTDDPFAVDELALPTVSTFKNPAVDGRPATRETDVGFDFSKEIFPEFALSISEDYVHLTPQGKSPVSGLANLGLNAKYQLWLNAPHEAVFSVGADWEVGGTGARRVGADSANVFTPTIYFGKGFGDLPGCLNYVRPFAVTGLIGEALPTSAEADSLEWGGALEYSLPYLQSYVKDVGLPAPFKNMIPLVEFAFSTPENRSGGRTTGTINPGVLWEAKYFQLGAEAIIPANGATGDEVGGVFQIQFYLDDLLPKLFGYPIFQHQ